MTWFEAEEIARYVYGLEKNLDEWNFNNIQMWLELAELAIVEKKLKSVIRNHCRDKHLYSLANEVISLARHCRHEIQERLMA
jgi:hypothetical protein